MGRRKLTARGRHVTKHKFIPMKQSVKTLQFEELKSLDLQTCHSVGDIVDAMRYCAFGARMLGEVATTLRDMALADTKC
jgi:hypothetical protein